MRCALAVVVSVVVVASAACGETFPIGARCVPDVEYDRAFDGFAESEVVVESNSADCMTHVCLVNHFRGRVSCPYGGDSCTVPATTARVAGEVRAQCRDRRPDTAVYCSCRCADENGERPTTSAFCDCPDGFTCTPLIGATTGANAEVSGSYCMKQTTKYDPTTSCVAPDCDAKARNCE